MSDVSASPATEASLVGPAIFVIAAILVTIALSVAMRRVFGLIEHQIDQMTANHDGKVSLLLSPVPDALILAYGIEQGFVKLPEVLHTTVKPWPTVLDLLKRGGGHIAYTNKRSAAAMIAGDPEAIQISDEALCRYAGSAIMVSKDAIENLNLVDLPATDVADLFARLPAGKIAAFEDSDQIRLLRRIFKRFEIPCHDRILPVAPSEDLVAAASDHNEVIGYFGSVTERIIGLKSGFVAVVDHQAVQDFELSKEVNALAYRTEKGSPTYNASVRLCVKSIEDLWWTTIKQLKRHEHHRDGFLKLLNAEVSENYRHSEAKFSIDSIFTRDDVDRILESWFVFDVSSSGGAPDLKIVHHSDPKAA